MKTPLAFYFGCIVLLLLFAVENVAGQACSSNPCQNGGSCFEVSTDFLCSCSSNFTGVTCETALNEDPVMCVFNSCANGGDCSLINGVIECKCTTNYTGPNCETLVNIIPSTEPTTQTATTSRISNPEPSPVDLWIIIAIAVAAAIVVILVVILIICVILKGKSSSGKSRTTSRPRMIADFTHHADRDNNTTNPTCTSDQHNTGYDDEDLNDDDYPPPSYNESNMNEGYTFTDSNQLSHVNNLDYDKNSDGDSLDALETDYKFDMY